MFRTVIAKGDERKENIKKALGFIGKDIKKAIKKKNSRTLFIKINAIDTNFPLACTHVDALEAVLDFIEKNFRNNFDETIVGDNAFVFSKFKGGMYRRILRKFPQIKLSDLSEFPAKEIEFKTVNGAKKSKISLLSKKAFTVSLAVPKTHDTFVYTGCLKNMFGCVIEGRGNLHATPFFGRAFLNKYGDANMIKWQNLIKVIEETMPDLCVLDGFDGMEGDGPMFGTKVHLGIALAGLDGVSLDKLASRICSMNNVPYLSLFKNQEKSEIIKVGFNNFNEIAKKFKMHYSYKYQISRLSSAFPVIDARFILGVMKRAYRIRDKAVEKIKSALQS